MDAKTGMKAIVIEDNQDLNDMLVEDLRTAGYDCAGFDSVEAYQHAQIQADILLLDVNLPGKSGLEFAQDLRARDKRIGLVILSVRTGAESRITGYQAGVDVYLQKPVGSQEMLAAVERVAERVKMHGGGQPQDSRHGRLILDRLTFAGPGGDVVLSPREAQMLAALARVQGENLSYDACKAIYSEGDPVKDATLEVAIGRLRKKIETVSGQRKSIVAVRGKGYRLTMDIALD